MKSNHSTPGKSHDLTKPIDSTGSSWRRNLVLLTASLVVCPVVALLCTFASWMVWGINPHDRLPELVAHLAFGLFTGLVIGIVLILLPSNCRGRRNDGKLRLAWLVVPLLSMIMILAAMVFAAQAAQPSIWELMGTTVFSVLLVLGSLSALRLAFGRELTPVAALMGLVLVAKLGFLLYLCWLY